MTVTSLFVELVVGGLHALIWVALAILAFVGYQSIDWDKLTNLNWAVPILAVAYIIGIIVDRLADSLFVKQEFKLRDPYKDRAERRRYLFIRYTILLKSKEIYEQLEYTRSRLRIARTAILNFAFTTVAAILFVVLQLGPALGPNLVTVCIITGIIGLIVTGLTYQAWVGLTRNYYLSALIAYDAVREVDRDGGRAEDATPQESASPEEG